MTSHVGSEPPSAYSQKLRSLSDRANIDLSDNGIDLRGRAAVMPYGAFSKKDTRPLGPFSNVAPELSLIYVISGATFEKGIQALVNIDFTRRS